MLNVASFRVMKRVVETVWGKLGTEVVDFCAQGDDIMFASRSKIFIERLMGCYNVCGYVVHPEKTYLSKRRTEFLRRNIGCEGSRGYRSRSLLSILWKSPILPVMPNPWMRLYNRCSQWHIFFQRGADLERVLELS